MATLAERVYEADSNELGPWESLGGVTELPDEAINEVVASDLASTPDEQRADLGRLLQWAFRYGVAYATLRHDDPLIGESTAQVRGKEAASKATRWHATVGGKPENES